jgi:4-diphosphocytidyl-2C-methyl-D-erythritol kinase
MMPELDARLDKLRDAGALAARVTGSGPTVFGVFHAGEAPELEGALQAEVL